MTTVMYGEEPKETYSRDNKDAIFSNCVQFERNPLPFYTEHLSWIDISNIASYSFHNLLQNQAPSSAKLKKHSITPTFTKFIKSEIFQQLPSLKKP